ncbi:MAG: cell division protein FtsW [Planctomycetota bacterium]|jgi:cell division protein FtsW
MGRRSRTNVELVSAFGVPARQMTFVERLDQLARRGEAADVRKPACGVLSIVLALMALGFVLQVSHASTTLPLDVFQTEVKRLVIMRGGGLLLLLVAMWLGPRGFRPLIPALTGLAVLALIAVYVPGFKSAINGARRWVTLPVIGGSFQPSEIARVLGVLWVAYTCDKLGERVTDGRRGYLPMVGFGLLMFLLILGEPDLGGAMLFLLCFGSTMAVGGARPAHVGMSMMAMLAFALAVGVSAFAYVRERFAVWLGDSINDQVSRSVEAMASGDMWGVGLAQGGFRNTNLQYMQTDYAFSLVGEELGFAGMLLVVGLWLGFTWFSFRLVVSVKDRFSALVVFGLLVSVAYQAMLHVQVVTGLAPPKGMNLPFLSDGGTALVASCLAVGLALGAARTGSFTGSGSHE